MLRPVNGDTTSIIPWDGPVTLAGVGVSSARRFAGVFGVVLVAQTMVGAVRVDSAPSTAPRITAVVSSLKGRSFDLEVVVRHGSQGSSTRVVSTQVLSNGGRCSVGPTRTSCTLRGLRRGALLTLRVVSRLSNAVSLSGEALEYRVGHEDWRIARAPTTSTTTTVPASFAGRTYSVHSSARSAGTKMPVVVVLHGYGSRAELQADYMGLRLAADTLKFHLLMPDGTKNQNGERFWNAGPVCCDFFSSGVDDERFLLDLVRMISARPDVDVGRIYLVGHSNGGAMAYRMVCHHPALFAAVVSLAGIGQYGTTSCIQSSPVGALHVHGSSDDVVLFNGGLRNGKPYVGARPMIEQMATVNGCSPTAEENAGYVDVVRDLSGAETQVSRWSGCARGVRTELWTIPNGSHIPQLSTDFSTLVYGFLVSHSK